MESPVAFSMDFAFACIQTRNSDACWLVLQSHVIGNSGDPLSNFLFFSSRHMRKLLFYALGSFRPPQFYKLLFLGLYVFHFNPCFSLLQGAF